MRAIVSPARGFALPRHSGAGRGMRNQASAASPSIHSSTPNTTDLHSIYQLGLLIVATDKEHARLDIPGGGNSQAMDTLSQREQDLWNVIASMQALTMADVAVQIGVGFHISAFA